MRDAMRRIEALARPGQSLNIHGAIDVLCDIWNEAKRALDNEAMTADANRPMPPKPAAHSDKGNAP